MKNKYILVLLLLFVGLYAQAQLPAPQNLQIQKKVALTITWNAINNAPTLQQYQVWRGLSPVSLQPLAFTNDTLFTDDNVVGDNRYFYAVRGIDTADQQGLMSNVVDGTAARGESEPNNTFANAQQINSVVVSTMAVDTDNNGNEVGDIDIYKIEVDSGVMYEFVPEPISLYYQPVAGVKLRLHYQGDTLGVINLADPDGNYGFPTIQFEATKDTVLYLRVLPTLLINSDYKLTVNKLRSDSYEPNNVLELAYPISPNSYVGDASIFGSGDNDFYKFDAGMHQQLTLQWFAPQQGYVAMYNAQMQLIKEAWLNNSESLTYNFLYTQTCYLRINAGADPVGNYAFALQLAAQHPMSNTNAYLLKDQTASFDNEELAAGWQILDMNKDGQSWKWGASGGYVTSGMSLALGNDNNDDWLVTPRMVVPQDGELRFWVRSDDGASGLLEAWSGLYTLTSTSELVKIESKTISGSTYSEIVLDLSTQAGDTIRVGLRGINLTGRLLLDQVTLVQGVPGAKISGSIVDLKTAVPLSDVLVKMNNVQATTDASGYFMLPKHPLGLQQLQITKNGYTSNMMRLQLSNDTVVSLQLAPLENNVLYRSSFEQGQDIGSTDTVINNGWRVSGQVSTTSGTLKPYQGQTMLLFGGSNYATSLVATWYNLPNAYTDLSACQTATISYGINHDLGQGDKVMPVVRRNDKIAYININNDDYADLNDAYQGSSNGWVYKTYDLSAYCGIGKGENIDFGFMVISNDQSTGNFGVAIDSVSISGVVQSILRAPEGVTAQSYINDTVKLSWNTVTDATGYKIYRRSADSSYLYVGTSVNTSYNDITVENGKRYYYQVSAISDFTESKYSHEVMADAGMPPVIAISAQAPYRSSFETDAANKLWTSWSKGYQWQASANVIQDGMLMVLPESNVVNTVWTVSRDKKVVFDNANPIQATAVGISPLFGMSTSSDVLVSFKNISKNSNTEQHVLVVRTLNGTQLSDWMVVDTVFESPQWQRERYVVKTNGATTFQLGFKFSVSSQSQPMGWAVDSIEVAPLQAGGIDGMIKSSANKPVYGARVEALPVGLVTYTDATGYYSFKPETNAKPLFAGLPYQIKITSYAYADTLTDNIIVQSGVLSRKDVVLDYQEVAPSNLSLSYTPTSNAILTWQKPQSPEVLQWDDNQADGTQTQLSTIIKANVVLPKGRFRWSGIQMLVEGGQFAVKVSSLRIYNVKGSDTTVYFSKKGITIDSITTMGAWVWAQVKADCYTDTNAVTVEMKTSAKLRLAFDEQSQSQQYALVNNQWTAITKPNVLRVKLNLGGEFLNTYNVYKTENNQPTVIENITSTTYTDTKVGVGSNVTYTVKALYNTQLSSASNQVRYALTSFALLSTSGQDSDSILIHSTQAVTIAKYLSNKGLTELNYKVRYVAGYLPDEKPSLKLGLQENATWARVRCFDAIPAKGDTAILRLYLENEYRYPDYHVSQVEMNFPQGIEVLSSTPFETMGSKGAEFSLSTPGTQGNGATIRWFDNDGGRGNIKPDQVAVAMVKIVVKESYQGQGIASTIKGDIDYMAGNVVQTNVRFDVPPFSISFTPTQGKVVSSDSVKVTAKIALNEKKPAYYPGYWLIESNAVNTSQMMLPLNISVTRGRGNISGTVSNIANNSLLQGIKVWLTDTLNGGYKFVDTTDAQGKFSFSGVTTASYRLSVEERGFFPYQSVYTLSAQGQEIKADVLIQADVRAPYITKISDDTTEVSLQWQQRSFDAFDGMEGSDGTSVAGAWSAVESNGSVWQYRKNGLALEGSGFVQAGGGSGAMMITKQPVLCRPNSAKLMFSAINTGMTTATVKESFVVRISTQGNEVSDFGDPILSYQFTNFDGWKHFEVPLQTTSDSLWIAIERTSSGDGALAIDALTISDVLSIPAGMNEPFAPVAKLQNYLVYRSTNNGDVEELALLENNLTSLVDNQIIAGNTYTYSLKAVYDIATSDVSEQITLSPINYTPHIAAIGDYTINENDTLAIALSYYDLNGAFGLTLTVTPVIERFSTWMSNDSLYIVPFKDWNGMSRIEVVVSDGLLSDTASFKLTVNNINNAPQITSASGTIAYVSKLFSFAITASDADKQDVLTISVTGLPSWLTFDANTATLTGTPQQANAGQTTVVSVKVSDGTVETQQQLSITVAVPNMPPAFTSQPIEMAEMLKAYVYNITASDPDADSVVFEAITKPSWLKLTITSRNTATLSGNTPFNAADTIVVISIGDGINAALQQQFVIKVKTVGINDIGNQESLRLYPSPANDFVTIQTNNALSHNQWSIIDAQGNQVMKGKMLLPQQTVNIQHLPQGAYLINIDNGKQLQSARLLIVR